MILARHVRVVAIVGTLAVMSAVGGYCYAGQSKQPTKPTHQTAVQLDAISLARLASKVAVQVSVPTGPSRASLGSGVWIDKGGYIGTCWHVVKDAAGPIEIGMSSGESFDSKSETFMGANFVNLQAEVVAKDENEDLAILKTSRNPFSEPIRNFMKFNGKGLNPESQVPILSTDFPPYGAYVSLMGYPLSGAWLVTQSGTVAGFEDFPSQGGEPISGVRILVSVVSNPGNSGGPVLDGSGHLVGILEGNLGSPMRDEKDRQLAYVRPKRDDAGNPVTDSKGNTQLEVWPEMSQNSGISVVVPAKFIADLLKKLPSR